MRTRCSSTRQAGPGQAGTSSTCGEGLGSAFPSRCSCRWWLLLPGPAAQRPHTAEAREAAAGCSLRLTGGALGSPDVGESLHGILSCLGVAPSSRNTGLRADRV